MKENTVVIGRKGEDEAIQFLKKENYKIIHRRWKYGRYEIDIIAMDQQDLVFIEVKKRNNNRISVDQIISEGQKKRIIQAAHYYITTNAIDSDIRFDLIFMDNRIKTTTFTHYKDFFSPTID